MTDSISRNPILSAFRLRGVPPQLWLKGSVLTRVAYNVGASQAQVIHARKVLTRLSSLGA